MVYPVPIRRGDGKCVVEMSACSSTRTGRVPPCLQLPSNPLRPKAARIKELRWIPDFPKPILTHLKNANLIRRTETILHRAKQAVSMMTLSFKIKHTVHHVLQHPWACYGAFFCHMSDKDGRNALHLRQPHKAGRAFPNLGYAARRAGYLRQVHRLNGVNDNEARLYVLNGFLDRFQIGFAEDKQLRDSAPSRSARSLVWRTDSSPEMYRTRMPFWANRLEA